MNKKDLVLRIGVIESGRIIEEFIVKDKKDVTLGNDIRNSIVIYNPKLPSRYKLFTYSRGSYFLNTQKFMLVTVNSDVIKEKKTVKLSSESRGKIDISNNQRILFQFIKKPEELIIPRRLPKQFRNKITDYIDWKFLIPLGISLVIHLIWMLWMYTLDLRPSDDIDVARIPDRFREVIIEPEKKVEPVKEVEDTKGDSDDKKIVKKVDKPKPLDTSKMTKKERKNYARKTVKSKSKVLSALDKLRKSSGGGGGTFGPIGGGNSGDEGVNSLAELDSGNIVSSGSGTGDGSGGSINMRGGGAAGGGGTGYSRTTKQSNGPKGISTNIATNRKEVRVKKKVRVAIAKTDMKADIKVDKNLTKSSARRAIKKSKRKVNSCYQRETKKNNSFAGRLTIGIMVGLGGKPLSVDIISSRMNDTSLQKSLVRCIKSRLKRITFPSPENPPVQIKFTAAFSSGS